MPSTTRIYLLWVNVKNLCCIRTRHCDESGRVHFSSVDTFLPNDRHPILQPVHAVGDFAKVLGPHFLLLVGERAIVAAGGLEVTLGEEVHQIAGRGGVRSKGWRENVGGSVTPGFAKVITPIRPQSGGDGFSEDDTAFNLQPIKMLYSNFRK